MATGRIGGERDGGGAGNGVIVVEMTTEVVEAEYLTHL